MDTEIRLARFRLSLLLGLLLIVAAFAGRASITERRDAERDAVTGQAPADARRADDGSRGKAPCAGCGVVESVRRIDRSEIVGDVCAATDFNRFGVTGSARDGGATQLADVIDRALAGRNGAKRMTVSSRYQIVIRLRDGSRRVFDEATARTMQTGERVVVIAGLQLPER